MKRLKVKCVMPVAGTERDSRHCHFLNFRLSVANETITTATDVRFLVKKKEKKKVAMEMLTTLTGILVTDFRCLFRNQSFLSI